jgi:hypothetical protein
MAASRSRETDRFEVKGSTGRIYTITERTDQIDVTTLDDEFRRWEDVQKSYLVLGGGSVSRINDSSFVLVATGETVTRL